MSLAAASPPALNWLDLDRFAATPLVEHPFPYLIVPGFLTETALPALKRDFPLIQHPGSFPASELRYGGSFASFLDALQDTPLRNAFARKFDIDLSGRPTMVTVRGRAQLKDGRVHTDSKTKIITALIYMNGAWEAPGGRLRLLRSEDSLEDMIAEVPPVEGTLIAFRVTPNSWHGHAPFVGERRVIQLNWVIDEDVVQHEQVRHRRSARLKKLFSLRHS